ncbi:MULTISPECIES: hypothetical protein [unclassified Meiothermus]|uniref:hypothetical protein n=1 Tax=unclassified Meiothermus TaxID=370471 RepID=UPI000D7CB9D7|nr:MULTISPECIES: hypothetical protein [unclassified Meiothermus]PZA08502.1 hypothetical protein DNA98_00150 [Meiothermus sp. Pnk-1]RYM36891.1 hypothetical protein EWH23_08120 [Meiothermus sp. PNK-Is4]
MARTILATVLALLSSLALAQEVITNQQGPGAQQSNPELRKRLEQYRPVFDLMGSLRLMLELDRQKNLSFTKAQAQKLLPILKNLQTRADLKPADAEKILSNIEDNILTPAQLKWMDETQLKRQEEMRQRRQNREGPTNSFGGGGGPNNPGGPGGQGGPRGGGLFQAIQQGKPFNPFKEGRAAEELQQLIALLSKR